MPPHLPGPTVTRRGLLAAAGGGALLLAACEEEDDEPGTPATTERRGTPKGDAAILNTALDLELMAVVTFQQGIPLLKGRVKALGERMLEHEQDHVATLRRLIRDLGAEPNRPRKAYDIPTLRTPEEVLEFALALEQTELAAYLDALPKLGDPELRGTATAILTTEAEHVAVIKGELGMEQVPQPFVTGLA